MLYLRFIAVLGFFITIMPYLHFPREWTDVVYTIFGLLILFFTYRLKVLSGNHTEEQSSQSTNSYTQNDQ